MELLIPGLILVAVMVWASTRIKRNAASAFEPESIESREFTIKKSGGWLSIVEPRDDKIFEAYSKDFGKNAAENIRLGTAELRVSPDPVDKTFATAVAGAKLLDERREVVDEVHYRIAVVERSDADADFRDTVKVAEKNGRVYTLSVRTLSDTADDFRRGVEEMVDSFALK